MKPYPITTFNYPKNVFIFKAIFVSFFILQNCLLQSQTLINELWEIETNYPTNDVTWSASVLNSSSDLFTTGNTWHNETQKVNIITSKRNSSGTLIWETEYNGTLSGFDYGAAICLDGSGNVYIAGATHNTSATTFDIVVIKYNSSGTQQWATLFNGSGSEMDIASGICLDGSGNIYVCGASTGSTTGYDYVTIQLNSAGTLQWSNTYDYASLSDVPGYIAWNSGTSKVGIAGASQSTATNWDYTTLKYNSSGTLTNTNRSSATGYGFDRPTGLVTDATGNFYITGFAYNGTDYDMRTIKLDDDLSPIWTQTEDGSDEDGSNNITIDGSNNTYICGFSTNVSGKKEMQIIKYNSSGTKQWTQTLANKDITIDAQAMAIKYNGTSNRIVISGYYEYSFGNKVMTTFALNPSNGSLIWKKEYPNLAEQIDVPKWVDDDGDNIWVTGTRTVDDVTQYLVIKYEVWHRHIEMTTDENDVEYADNQIIISFNPDEVNLEFVNNRQVVYTDLENAISEDAYDLIFPIISNENVQFNSNAVKIFKTLIADDLNSISRQGKQVIIPPFWASLVVSTNIDPTEILEDLNNLPEIIQSAELNIGYKTETLPDDTQTNQESLLSIGDADEDINFESAYTAVYSDPFNDIPGSSHVRVGIYDSGIFWAHEDFGDGTAAGSVVTDGYDYDYEYSYENDNNDASFSYPHGTWVAGIIGAISNNGLGISGIAGGNFEDETENAVQLVDLDVGLNWGGEEGEPEPSPPLEPDGTPIFTEFLLDAIFEGATSYIPGGPRAFSLNVMNHSWGVYPPDYDEPDLLIQAVAYAFTNGCTVVCSKGNLRTNDFHIPSDLSDVQVISVGGSGTDGQYEPGDLLTDEGSNFGNEVDLIAPYGYGTIVMSLDNEDASSYFTSGGELSGTSISAPHVSGATALLMSYLNNPDGGPHFENLAPEDVENILQLTASDKNTAEYDELTGFGLLDLEAAFAQVEKPSYKVQHFCQEIEHGTVAIDEADMYLDFDEWTHLSNGLLIPYGTYLVDRYKVDETFYHTLSPTAEIVDGGFWKLQSMSDILPESFPETIEINYEMESPTETEVHIVGYFYHFKERYDGAVLLDDAVNKWVPSNIFDSPLQICYTLLTYDEEATETEELILNNETSLLIYPNPAHDILNLNFNIVDNQDALILVTDIIGKHLITMSVNLNSVNKLIQLDIEILPTGIYQLTIGGTDFNQTVSFIKS